MGLYADPADIASRWGGYRPEIHEALAVSLIGDAEALLLDRIPQLPLRIANGVVSEQTVSSVVVDIVKRVLRNPEGFRSEADGDYNYAYAPGAYTPGEVGVTSGDLARLNGNRRGATLSAGADDPAMTVLVRGPDEEWFY